MSKTTTSAIIWLFIATARALLLIDRSLKVSDEIVAVRQTELCTDSTGSYESTVPHVSVSICWPLRLSIRGQMLCPTRAVIMPKSWCAPIPFLAQSQEIAISR